MFLVHAAQVLGDMLWAAKTLFHDDGQRRLDINPSDYFPRRITDTFLNYADKYCGNSVEKVVHVNLYSIRGVMWTIQKIYFYKIGKLAQKKTWTPDDMATQAIKARKIGEKAIKDLIACRWEIGNEHMNDLMPGLMDEPRFRLPDKALEVNTTTGFDMLKFLVKIAPDDITRNIKINLNYFDKYGGLMQYLGYDENSTKLDDAHTDLFYSAHKIAMLDFERKTLFGDTWEFSQVIIKKQQAAAFSSMDERIKAHEIEIGKTIDIEPIIELIKKSDLMEAEERAS